MSFVQMLLLIALAVAIGVPAVAPQVDRLWTSDFIHLCPLSGKRFARALLRGVDTLDVLRAPRHLPAPGSDATDLGTRRRARHESALGSSRSTA